MAELPKVTLSDPSSQLSAVFVPQAGMIGTSLALDGIELLGQRRGLDGYLTAGKTMGIPLLYPWANRLSANTYPVDGGAVTLTPGIGGVRTDQHGVPIHGLLAGYPDWRVIEQSEHRLAAELDFGSVPRLLASFPFPHVLTYEATIADSALTIRMTVTPTSSANVPLCFGFHPYLQLPEVPRTQWTVDSPALRYRPVNAWGIPTGETQPQPATSERLGDQVLDNGYDEAAPGAVFAVAGGGRRIEVCLEEGYPAAQVFAPGDDEVICFEPMAAPTDALRRGGYRVAKPGEAASAAFSIRVR